MNTTLNENVTHSGNSKTHALISYILMAIGLFTAIPLFIGAVWAMFTRSSSRGTIYYSHYTNAIRTFWWSVFWTVVGCLLIWAVIGIAILGVTWLWVLYRTIFGLAKIMNDEPYEL